MVLNVEGYLNLIIHNNRIICDLFSAWYMYTRSQHLSVTCNSLESRYMQQIITHPLQNLNKAWRVEHLESII